MFKIKNKSPEDKYYTYLSMSLHEAYNLGLQEEIEIGEAFGIIYSKQIRLFFDIDVNKKG
jgi:hypothetical protein